MQASVLGRGPERVGFECEVVHSDFSVTDLLQHLAAHFIERAFFVTRRKVSFGEAALTWFDPRYMGVGVECDAIRAKAFYRVNRFTNTIESLKGKAIDQVVIHAREPVRTREFGGAANHLFALHAVNDVLNTRVEILYSQTQAAETELGESLEVLF